ncbi:MAG: Arm DNA-binding domain-containing protein, partial [bacterium]
MAYIKKTKSGKYQAQVYVKNPLTNKRKRLYKTFDSKKKAKLWASNKKNESDSGNLKDPQNKTVTNILLEWLEEHATHVEANTHNSY